jgi:ferrous iron transport protein A
MSKIDLNCLKPSETAVIAEVSAESAALQQRLFALGFRKGRQITMLRKASFNGPVHVRVGTSEIMLRRRDAKSIQLIKISSEQNDSL